VPPATHLRRAASVCLLLALAQGVHAEDERDRLERNVHMVWVETAPDHDLVRQGGLEGGADALAAALRRILAEDPARYAKPGERVEALRGAVARARRMLERDAGPRWPVSRTTTALALDRCWPGPPPGGGDFGRTLVARLAELFARDRFADCWDESFRDLPEVRAWRAFHEKAADPAPRPPDVAKPPVGPDPPPVNLADRLVFLDKSRSWVGPWTGWTEDIKKDNKRQKRSSDKTRPVWIERHEVTRGDYLDFLRGVEAAERKPLLPKDWTLDAAGDPVAPDGAPNVPVTGVTLVQAMAYADSHGMRLPTEDEWDRAAAGGDKEARTYPWGNSSEGKRWANQSSGLKGPVPVDAFPDDATPDGLILGLAGNVAELVATQPDRKDLGSKLPEGEFDVVIRGGNYQSRDSDCQTSFRWKQEAGVPSDRVGFRCVMDDAEYRRRFR
jgi:formylglycine-generating enzyme required for sulfatase activity